MNPQTQPQYSFDPADMALRGRIGAYRLHATHDARITSAPGRAAAATALTSRLLDEIDPPRQLPVAERERRLEHARRAYFAALAYKSAKARAKKTARSTSGGAQ